MADNRKRVVAALAAVAVLAVGAPSASAEFGVGPGNSPIGNDAGVVAPCGRFTPEGQAGTGASELQICQGGGQSFVGSTFGQSSSVVGPTITGPTAVGNIAVGAGDAAAGG